MPREPMANVVIVGDDPVEDSLGPEHLCSVMCTQTLKVLGYSPNEIATAIGQAHVLACIASWAVQTSGNHAAMRAEFEKHINENLRQFFEDTLTDFADIIREDTGGGAPH